MPGPLNLDDKFEAAFRPEVKVERSTGELIEYASQDGGISALFGYMKTQDQYRRILLLHRADLFGPNLDFLIPHFHFSSTAAKPTSARENIVIENALETGASLVAERKAQLIELLGLNEEQIERYLMDVKDIAAYLLIEFVRRNPNVLEMVNAPTFDYATMKRGLKDYKSTVSFEPLSKMFSEEGEGAADPVIAKKIETLLLAAMSVISENMKEVLENTHKLMPNLMMPFHLTSAAIIQKILKASHTTLNDYADVLEGLYLRELITNQSTVWWCQSCSVENPASEQRIGRLAPSKMMKNRCLTCNKPQSYGSIYSIDEDLQDMIFCKDGLLAVYLGWLLTEKGIEFEAGTTSGKYEHDFLLKNGVISCKMFKANKDEIAIRSELDSAFAQLQAHISDLETEGRTISYAWVVWNRHGPTPEMPAIMQRYSTFLKKYNVVVIQPADLADRVNALEP